MKCEDKKCKSFGQDLVIFEKRLLTETGTEVVKLEACPSQKTFLKSWGYKLK